jgi:hypothetical protein
MGVEVGRFMGKEKGKRKKQKVTAAANDHLLLITIFPSLSTDKSPFPQGDDLAFACLAGGVWLGR